VDDSALLAGLASDLDGSFEELVVRYQDRLYRFALRLSGSAQDAEEVAQDAFVRAYEALKRYPAQRVRTLALRAWLYQITLNVFRNRMRRRQLSLVPLDGNPIEGVEQELPEQAAERAESRQELAALVAALPERHRVAVVLRHVEGLSYAEIAAVLGQPAGTIKANVHRGLQTLRSALSEYEREVPA
jgi:RNA polymerase sigma-70 factor (ECF subfamily)